MALSRKKRLLAAGVVLALLAAAAASLLQGPGGNGQTLTLYGNVDIREVQAAFNDSGRITQMPVQEGGAVHPGELLATLDDTRFVDALNAAQNQAASQAQVLAALRAGSRPEEIAQAKAEMDALDVVYQNDRTTYRRLSYLTPRGAAAQQQLDDAQAAYNNAAQNYAAAKQAYILAVKGPRQEDIAAAAASYQADLANAALAAQELADTKLYAPAVGVVEDRVQEPGDMTSPATPVYTIALTNPLWVRAYVPESSLGKINLGMAASVGTDSYPGKLYHGWVGYISPTAEFTPKNVETPDLRAELVYQMRVYVCDADGQLRLGMPATVTIALDHRGTAVTPGGCGADASGN